MIHRAWLFEAPWSNGNAWRRRAIVVLSTMGAASTLAVSFLQTGILKHLPDPPIAGFDSDQVDLSPAAFPFGIPDGTLDAVSFAANLPLAGLGDPRRFETKPWLPLLASAKATMDAVMAGWYFVQMPTKEHAFCGYCIAGSLSSLAILALTVPEAREAFGSLFGQDGSRRLRAYG